MIRACFGERDMRTRAGACHDLYEFSGALTLDAATRPGGPRFRLATRARTFPGRIGREDDNSAKRLTKRELVWARDPVCSYARLLSWRDPVGSRPTGHCPIAATTSRYEAVRAIDSPGRSATISPTGRRPATAAERARQYGFISDVERSLPMKPGFGGEDERA